MKIHRNIEQQGFRATLIFETNDKLGHKILSEDLEFLADVCDRLDVAGAYIISAMNDIKIARKLE